MIYRVCVEGLPGDLSRGVHVERGSKVTTAPLGLRAIPWSTPRLSVKVPATTPASLMAKGPQSINAAGAIAGSYRDGNSVYHGFVRAPDGTFTTFEALGAGTGSYQGTAPI